MIAHLNPEGNTSEEYFYTTRFFHCKDMQSSFHRSNTNNLYKNA